METPTLDDTDERILERLAEGPRTAADLAEEIGETDPDLDERLAALEESGLVVSIDGYELTDSGRRLLRSPGDTTADDRIDVPDHVESVIQRANLPPDRAAAIRGVFAFLAYWGEASGYEIRDAIYSERPAGFGSAEEWWEFAKERLAELPEITPPASDEGTWRYAGKAGVDDPTDDGRHGPGGSGTAPYASVKHALESLDLRTEEREAVHGVFALLADRGDATETEIAESIYARHSAGYGSAEEWWDRLEELLAELPGVDRAGETWRYGNAVDDVQSPGDGSHLSETAEPMEKGSGADDDISSGLDSEGENRRE